MLGGRPPSIRPNSHAFELVFHFGHSREYRAATTTKTVLAVFLQVKWLVMTILALLDSICATLITGNSLVFNPKPLSAILMIHIIALPLLDLYERWYNEKYGISDLEL